MSLLPVAVLALQLIAPVPSDSSERAGVPPAPTASGAPLPSNRFGAKLPRPEPRITDGFPIAPLAAAQDSVPEYSASYYRRLDIHRWGSYAMLPLFAFQYWAGTQLLEKSSDASDFVKTGHAAAATGVATIFTVNTVTGLWNLAEGWRDPNERTRKRLHAILLLAADAGFVATGLLADEAEESSAARNRHRSVALGSMALATTGWLIMLDLFR